MSRISSYAVNTQLINRLLTTQESLLDLQTQVNTEKKSQTYSGIASDSQRLINIENTRDRLEKYINNNNQQQTRMQIAQTSVEAMRESITNFSRELTAYSNTTPVTEANVDAVQASAFRALRDMEDLLNIEVDGRFVFGGGRATTAPVDFGVGSISAFQAIYDGARVKVPETRDAHLEDFSFNEDHNNTNSLYIDSNNFLQFRQDGDDVTTTSGSSTIRASSAIFSNLTAGATITVADTASNNGTYTVDSVSSDGKTATLRTDMLTDETIAVSLTTETPAAQVTFLAEGDTSGTPSRTAAAVSEIAFDATNGTITATGGSVGLFSGLSAGDFITVGSSTSNNKTFQIGSVDGTNSIITIDGDPTTITLADNSTIKNAAAGDITFDRSANTIVATNAVFSGASAGEVITVAGTDENNGTYTIASVSTDGRTVTVQSTKLTDEGLSGDTFYDQYSDTDVSFDNSTRTIEVRRSGTTTVVPDIFNGLAVGDQFTIGSTTTNDGTYTIESISSDGSSVTVAESLDATPVTDTDGVTFTGSGNNFSYESGTLTAFDFSELRFTARNAANAADVTGVYSNLAVGDTITMSGSATGYNGTFVITEVGTNGEYIEVSDNSAGTLAAIGVDGTDAGEIRFQVFGADGTISADSFYSGDDLALTHRLDDDRELEFDIQANDPAFEKAIRAMKIILQGEFGTEGGLDQNADRISDAQYLLNAALSQTVAGNPPFGDELAGSIEQVEQDIGFDRFLLAQVNETNTSFIGFLDQSIAKTENADPLEAITRLLDDEQALSASYQTFARIRQLSLTNFL